VGELGRVAQNAVDFDSTSTSLPDSCTVTTVFDSQGAGSPGVATARRLPSLRRTLIAADLAALAFAYLLAFGVAGPSRGWLDAHTGLVIAAVASLPIWQIAAKSYGLYDRDEQRPNHSTVDDIGRIFNLVTTGVWLSVVAEWFFATRFEATAVIVFWISAVTLVVAARAGARSVVCRLSDRRQNTIIVGAGEVGQLVARKLVQHSEFGIRLLGFVDSDPRTMRADLEHLPVLGAPADIVEIVTSNDVGRVIVAFSNDRHDLLLDLVRSLRPHDVQIDVVPRLFEAVGPVVDLHLVEGLPLVGLHPLRPSWAARTTKRASDLVIAAVLLVLTSPLFAFIGWRIRRDSPGPIYFRQVRLGQGQKAFTLLKFRTMAVDTDDAPHRQYVRELMAPGAIPAANALFKLDRRLDITPVGRWLRRTSLDELPQLINVLRGEMSLVGPRPCIPYETELYEPHHFDRFLVPGGMTGLWQVAARAHSTLREALDLDVAYARDWSLALDFSLLARTPSVLLRRRETA
jgi:exopolysaccharide biosynthesis polyprenyl glycosylphosphotransferase